MLHNLSISIRLNKLAKMLPKVDCAADIGTDHAWLLAYLIQNGVINKAIGVELVDGPYFRAIENVASQGLSSNIEIRKGDGLEPLIPGEVDSVIIAGMGGNTIVGILKRSPQIIKTIKWLLLQPMSQAGVLRSYLQQTGWRIQNEDLVEDRDIIYPMILARPGSMAPLNWLEAEYGPFLIKGKSLELKKQMLKDLKALENILRQLKNSNNPANCQKELDLKEKCRQIEEVLNGYKV